MQKNDFHSWKICKMTIMLIFISNGVDDVSHLKKSDIGISLGTHLETDIENTCDEICASNHPLKTIVESIGVSRKV